jgi:hypothetical protein
MLSDGLVYITSLLIGLVYLFNVKNAYRAFIFFTITSLALFKIMILIKIHSEPCEGCTTNWDSIINYLAEIYGMAIAAFLVARLIRFLLRGN